jgi:hypothetical protein
VTVVEASCVLVQTPSRGGAAEGVEDMDENTAQLVERCKRLLVEAKARHSAGEEVEAGRLLREAHRCATEAARASKSAVVQVSVPETLDVLATWELEAPASAND